jgi:hypothetical protein
MSDFPKKLDVVLVAFDQIAAWGLATACVAAVYLVSIVIGVELGRFVARLHKGRGKK